MIEDVDIRNRGRYVCLVSNAAGTARRVINLDVQGKSGTLCTVIDLSFLELKVFIFHLMSIC